MTLLLYPYQRLFVKDHGQQAPSLLHRPGYKLGFSFPKFQYSQLQSTLSDDRYSRNQVSIFSSDSESEHLHYGLTVTGKGLDKVLKEFDRILDECSAFSVKEVAPAVAVENGCSAEAKAAAYWTTLAPNVEDYSGSVAKMIAAGSVQLIRGILWCGDVTVERLKWGNEVLKRRTKGGSKSDVSPEALKRMKRYVIRLIFKKSKMQKVESKQSNSVSDSDEQQEHEFEFVSRTMKKTWCLFADGL